MTAPPRISVVVPAYNAADLLPRCLSALADSTVPPYELIVVDDRSTDGTAEIAARHGASVLTTPARGGPGAARNLAASAATGDVLLFVDADVVVAPDTIERFARHFANDRPPAAVFGSYDDDPPEANFMSRYKNLQHHYVHQQASEEASTFWAGCGAVSRAHFERIGGFDASAFDAPAIEDIELGARLKADGQSIRLDREIQVTHLKRWTFASVVRTDVLQRAVPWSRLLLRQDDILADLNLDGGARASAALSWLAVLALLAVPVTPWAVAVTLAALVGVALLNRHFYAFCRRRGGAVFALRVFPMHVFYFLYSAAAFAACWFESRILRR